MTIAKLIRECLGCCREGASTEILHSYCVKNGAAFKVSEISDQLKSVSGQLSKMAQKGVVEYISEGGRYRWKLSKCTRQKGKRTIKMEISFWQREDDIHISFMPEDISGVTGMTTINDKLGSKRRHEHLYKQFKSILISKGMWN